MREVDEALARAYAQREQSDPPQGVPPAPHWPARALKPASAPTPIAREPRRIIGRAAMAGARPDPGARVGRAVRTDGRAPARRAGSGRV